MAENKTMDSIHKGLLKKFHTLCGMLGIDAEGKRAIIESYGVESSRDIDTHDLVDLCAKMSEVQGRFIVAVDDSYEELVERLQKRKSPTFVIIDSFQEAYWSYEQARELITSFPRKSFIFISQEDKGQPMGKPAKRLRYKAGIKVRVSGFNAYCRGRYTGDPGSYYVVWEEGVMRTTNNVV